MPTVVSLVHRGAFLYVENKPSGYAGDSSLVAVVPSHAERVAITESMNPDLIRVSVWCDL